MNQWAVLNCVLLFRFSFTAIGVRANGKITNEYTKLYAVYSKDTHTQISVYATHSAATAKHNNIYSLFDMLNDNLLHCCTNNIQFTINIKIEFDVAYAAVAAAAAEFDVPNTVNKLVFAIRAKTIRKFFFGSSKGKKKQCDKIRSDIHAWKAKKKMVWMAYVTKITVNFDGFHFGSLEKRRAAMWDKDWVSMTLGEISRSLVRNRIFTWHKLLANNVTSNALHN